MKRKAFILLLLVQFFVLACSSPSPPVPITLASPTELPSATVEMPRASATLVPTEEPTSTPNSAISAADSQAAGIGTLFPQSDVAITKENLGDIELLAEWGRGLVRRVMYTQDGQGIVISTNRNVFLHKKQNQESEPNKVETGQLGVLSPDGSMLATETEIEAIDTGEVLYQYDPPPDKIPYIPSHFSPDGHYFGYHSFAAVKVVDLYSKEEIIFNGAQRIDFSTDGKTVALARGMEGVELYDLDKQDTLQLIVPVQENEEQKYPDYKPVTSLSFSSSGETLVVGYQPGEFATDRNTINIFEVFDVTTGAFLYGVDNLGTHTSGFPNSYRCDEPGYSPEPPGPAGVRKITYSPDGKFIAVVLGSVNLWADSYVYGSTLYLFRATDGQLLRKVSSSVIDFAFSPSSDFMTLLKSNGDVQEWRVKDISIEREISGYDGEVWDIKLDANENVLGVQYFYGVRLIDFHTGEYIAQYDATGYSFSPDKIHFALAYLSGKIEVRQISDQALVTTILGHDSSISDIKFLPSGQLASSASNCTAYLWSVPEGVRLYQFEDFMGSGSIVDKTRFAISEFFVLQKSGQLYGRFGEGYIEWDTSTGQIINTFPVKNVDDERPIDLFHPFLNTFRKRVVSTVDGELDINAGVGHYEVPAVYIDFYDIQTELQVFTLPAHTRTVSKLLMTLDGSLLVSASRDGTIRIWGIPSE